MQSLAQDVQREVLNALNDHHHIEVLEELLERDGCVEGLHGKAVRTLRNLLFIDHGEELLADSKTVRVTAMGYYALGLKDKS